jgi:CheY-like chemotaxis protein
MRQMPEVNSCRPSRVLVMDDEPQVLNTICQMLKILGHEITATEKGEEALEVYDKAMKSRRPFDFVILDLVNKRGMGGRETCEKLHAADPQVKAIAISAYCQDTVMTNPEQHGFILKLPKPFTFEELRRALGAVLQQNREAS